MITNLQKSKILKKCARGKCRLYAVVIAVQVAKITLGSVSPHAR